MNTKINNFCGLSTGLPSSALISAGTRTISGSGNKSGKDGGKGKKLTYNPREISSAILQASKAQSAGRVLTRARGKLNVLLKSKGCGMYDEAELARAIIHAKRMVRCAQMKTKNLKMEEQMQKQNGREHTAVEQCDKSERKLRIASKERDLIQDKKIEEMQRIEKEKRQNQELTLRRKMNRSRERSKIDEAGREYIENGNNSFENRSYGPGAVHMIQIEGVEMELTVEAEKRMEVQVEQIAGDSLDRTGVLAGTDFSAGTGMMSQAADFSGGISGAAECSAGGLDITV